MEPRDPSAPGSMPEQPPEEAPATAGAPVADTVETATPSVAPATPATLEPTPPAPVPLQAASQPAPLAQPTPVAQPPVAPEVAAVAAPVVAAESLPPALPAAPPPAPPQAAGPTYQWDQPAELAGPAPGVRFAGHAGRLVAYIVDGIILGIVTSVLLLLVITVFAVGVSTDGDTASVSSGSVVVGFIGLLIVFLVSVSYFPFFWARSGATPGMRLFRLRVVRDKDGGPISGGTAVLRLIGLWISLAVFYLGVIWILIDARRRGWHDLLAGTCVIEQV